MLVLAKNVEIAGKNVLVRGDLEFEEESAPRARAIIELVEYLQGGGARRIKVIGHSGNVKFSKWLEGRGIEVNSNLRADSREKENNIGFAEELATGFDIYINEAFGTSHRRHASVDVLPRLMKKQRKIVCIGERFGREIEMLGKVMEDSSVNSKILVLGGAKGDKLEFIDQLAEKFDRILLGGKLPNELRLSNSKFVVGNLREDGLDIDEETIVKFKDEIDKARIAVVAGPMGKYEGRMVSDRGTAEVYREIANSGTYKVAGGGDTEEALSELGLAARFDWISVGGGAMLVFLALGTLPGIEAVSSGLI